MKRKREDDLDKDREKKRIKTIISVPDNQKKIVERLNTVVDESFDNPEVSSFFSNILLPTGLQMEFLESIHCVRCHEDFNPAFPTKCYVNHSFNRNKCHGTIRDDELEFTFPCCQQKWKGNWMKEMDMVTVNPTSKTPVKSGRSFMFKEERERAIRDAPHYAEKDIPYCFVGFHTRIEKKVEYNHITIRPCGKGCKKNPKM